MNIGNRLIGQGDSVYIVAEMSGNHGQDFDTALRIIDAAKESGADAIKLQSYTPDTITLDSDKTDFQVAADSPWREKKNLHNLYQKAFTPWEWHPELFEYAHRLGLDIFSSPFDESAVDMLEKLGCVAYKIASPEINHIPLIKRVLETKKPIIFSTGLAEWEDLELVESLLKQANHHQFAFLKCTSAYPSPPESINLRTIPDMKKRFGCVVGLSDHTLGVGIPVASVALGARIIEKHLVLDKNKETVDSFFSLDPREFKIMCEQVRQVELALGEVSYNISPFAKSSYAGRRSLYYKNDLKKGSKITEDDIICVRPNHGLHPKHKDSLIGKTLSKNVFRGERTSKLDTLEDW